MTGIPPWITSLVRFGVTAAIAIYLVYSNTKLVETLLTDMNRMMIKNEIVTKDLYNAIKEHNESNNAATDGELRLLRVICRNTATDYIQRANCDPQ
jgi:hypothetical protein